MQILNIGPLELLFILIIAFVVLGPNESVRAASRVGKFISQVMRSPIWSDIVNTSRDLKQLPRKIIKEAEITEDIERFQKDVGEISRGIKEIGSMVNSENIPQDKREPEKIASQPDDIQKNAGI